MAKSKTEPDTLKSLFPAYGRVPVALLRSDLPSNAKVLFGILDSMTGPNGSPWPGLAYLAKVLRVKSITSVRTALSYLGEAGWLEIEHRDGRSNLYTCCIPSDRVPPQVDAPLQSAVPPPTGDCGGTPPADCTRNKSEWNKKKEPKFDRFAAAFRNAEKPSVHRPYHDEKPRCPGCQRLILTEDGTCLRCVGGKN